MSPNESDREAKSEGAERSASGPTEQPAPRGESRGGPSPAHAGRGSEPARGAEPARASGRAARPAERDALRDAVRALADGVERLARGADSTVAESVARARALLDAADGGKAPRAAGREGDRATPGGGNAPEATRAMSTGGISSSPASTDGDQKRTQEDLQRSLM